MKVTTLETNRYPGKDKSFLNLTIGPWLNERYKKVLEEGNPVRIAKYEGMSPLNLIVEDPLVVVRKEGYFRSTIIARKNGLCFPDPKIKFTTFEDFLLTVDPGHELYLNSNVPKEIDKKNLETMATSIDSFPQTAKYYLTKFKRTGQFALMVFNNNLVLNLDNMFKSIFYGFDFEEINGTLLESSDEGYPISQQNNAAGYVIGSLVVKDLLLAEMDVEISILNMKLIKEILSLREYYYDGKYKHNNILTYSGAKRNQ